MQGKATFRGHPIHLMLVSFPVAFWTGVLVTDGLGAVTRDPFWFRMSVMLLVMGSAGALLAAIFGYVDYLTIPMSRKARSIATGHLWWSLACIAVFPLACVLRWRDSASALGIAVTIVGTMLLLVGGYLGSELANRHRVGIADPVVPPTEQVPGTN